MAKTPNELAATIVAATPVPAVNWVAANRPISAHHTAAASTDGNRSANSFRPNSATEDARSR